MTADSQGNDVGAVGIPVTGFLGFAPSGTVLPTAVEGAAEGYTLPVDFKKAGLLKTDGGPQLAWASSGEPLEFWQDGYSIPSGLADVTLTATFAQTDAFVRELIYGKTPDVNNYLVVDGGGHAIEKVLFSEEIFKNGAIRRRVAPKLGVRSVAEDKSTRGEALGYAVVFEVKRSLELGGHFGEWVVPPLGTALPTITSALPASMGAGSTVDLVGTGFTGATSVTFGGIESPLFTVKSSTLITAALPAGAAGSAPIVVTTPVGASAAMAYTRIA